MRTATKVIALSLALLGASRAEAFRVTFGVLQSTPRWSVAALADGLDVCVGPGFAEAVGATTPAEIGEVETRVRSAFAAWQSPVLRFDVHFDCIGAEILVDTMNDPELPFYGATYVPFFGYDASRLLTNGQTVAGYTIPTADIRVNLARVLPFGQALPPALRSPALQRLLMHEVGHALGIDHPAGSYWLANTPMFDQDADPFNPMPVDGLAPFAGIGPTPNYDGEAIMMRELTSYAALFYTELRHDDRAARDVLYPLPPADADADGVLDRDDVCPLTADPAQTDGDADGVGDACDLAAGDIVLAGFLSASPTTGPPQLARLAPSGAAAPIYTPSGAWSLPLRGASYAEHMLAVAVPVTHLQYELRLADLARGEERTLLRGLERPLDLTVDALGRIVISLGGFPASGTIERVDPVRATTTPIASGLGGTGAIALDLDRLSIVATVQNALTSTIRSYPVGGGAQDLLGLTQDAPRGLAVEASGDVLYAAQGMFGSNIRRIDRTTLAVTELAANFSFLNGLAVDPLNGDVVVEYRDTFLSDRLARIDPVSGATASVPVTGFQAALDVAPGLFAVPAFPTDPDTDGVLGAADNCTYARNPDQRDSDGQGGGDVCDSCPLDPGDHCRFALTAALSIGPAGGSFSNPDGGVNLTVPPGALASETSLSISEPGSELELSTESTVIRQVELGPAGQTFAAPVTLTFEWDDANGDGLVDLSSLIVWEADLHLRRDGAPISGACGDPAHSPGTCTTSCCYPLTNRWTVEITGFSEYRLEGAPDSDLDGIPRAFDNCPFVRDPTGLDQNGDGVGTACQCGDPDRNGFVDTSSVGALRAALAHSGPPLASPGTCNVHGPIDPLFAPGAFTPRDCAIDDLVVLRRYLLSQPPGIGRCAGTPVLP